MPLDGLVEMDLGGRQVWVKGFAYTSKFRCLPETKAAIEAKMALPPRPRIPGGKKGLKKKGANTR